MERETKKKIKEIIPVLRARRHHRCATLFSSILATTVPKRLISMKFPSRRFHLNAGHLNAPRHIKNVCAAATIQVT